MSERLRNTLAEHFGYVDVLPIAGGHTRAERGLATLPGFGRCFVKAGYDDRTRRAIAVEAAVLKDIDSRHLPQLVHDEPGLLILEDLSDAHWPPPWKGELDSLWAALESVSGSPPPSSVTLLEAGGPWEDIDGVAGLLGDPLTRWLSGHLDRLHASALAVSPAGSDFVHADLSLENLCVAPRGVVLVDWEFASIGNREIDIATVSLELIAEGLDHGVPLADRAGWAARLGTWLLAGSVDHSEWARDREALRAARLRLAEVALLWWADESGLSSPPPLRDARRSE